MVNTLLENMTPIIKDLTKAEIGIRILSNYCTERKTMSSFIIEVDKLKYKEIEGKIVADKIIQAYEFA